MRITTALGLVFLLLLSESQAQLKGDSFEKARQEKKASLEYVFVNISGFAYTDDQDQPKGILFDLIQSFEGFVLNKYGIEIISKKTLIPDSDFKVFLETVKAGSGGVFGLSTTTINSERKSFLSFSPAYLNNISVLISHNSVPTLTSMNDISNQFADLSAYSAPGTTYSLRVEEVKNNFYPNLTVKNVASEAEFLISVVADKKSFGFIDIGTYLDQVNRKQPIKRHPAGDKTGEQFGIILPYGSDWTPIITNFLNSGFLTSAEYRQIVINHLGKSGLRMIPN